MTHEELRDRLLDLAYGELSPREAREVEDHAAACEACRAELAVIRGTRRVMAALPVEPAPERGERILVAAAREAARTRAAPRGWPRWLWAAPVVGVSLAVVIALSVRLQAPPPPSAAHEDPDALRGEPASRYAQAPAAAAPPAASAQAGAAAADASAGAAAARDEAPPLAMKKAEAPRRDQGGPSRLAVAPPEAPSPRPSPPLRGREGEGRADRAEAFAAAPAEAPSGKPAPPRRGEQGIARADRAEAFAAAPPPAVAAAPSAPSAGALAAPSAGAAPAPSAEAEARVQREAAPARRAKALAAPQVMRDAASPRDRAVAAARVRAASLGFDTGGTEPEAGAGALTWEAWRSQAPALAPAAPPAALAGRRFWPVIFRQPAAGGTLVVFVEDGTFRALAELRGD